MAQASKSEPPEQTIREIATLLDEIDWLTNTICYIEMLRDQLLSMKHEQGSLNR
jgi:hypothetical protein